MRWFVRILLLIVVLAAVYVGTAVLSLKGLVEDAQRADSAALMARIDLPRLRTSLADQIIRAMFARIEQTRPVKTLERVATPTVVDALVAKLLTPENITRALQSGEFRVDQGQTPTIALPPLTGAGLDDTVAMLGRLRPQSPMELKIMLDSGGPTAIRLHNKGTHWKLSGLDLPPAALEKLVAAVAPK